MRKLFLPSALILLLGFGLAVAQQINSSVQLSQDARGVYGVDTNQNLYLLNNRHLNAQSGLAAPTVNGTGCAVGTNSTDFSGTLTGCSGNANTVTFGQVYGAAPRCIATSQATANGAMAVTATVSQFSISAATAGIPNTWNWLCIGVQ